MNWIKVAETLHSAADDAREAGMKSEAITMVVKAATITEILRAIATAIEAGTITDEED